MAKTPQNPNFDIFLMIGFNIYWQSENNLEAITTALAFDNKKSVKNYKQIRKILIPQF